MANHPGTSAISGSSTQTPMRTPTTPATAPAARSAERTVAPGRVRVQPGADEQPEGLADERRAEEDADGDEQELRRSWRRRASRSTGGSTSDADHDARAPSPTHEDDTGEEPEAVAADGGADRAARRGGGRACSGRAAQQARVGEEAGVGHHPVVGAHRLPSMCHPRCSTSIVSAIPKADSASVSRSCTAWVICGV